jgi:short-chain fatty acids transporter
MVVGAIRRVGERFADFALEYIPDPYVFAVLLTVIAFLGALGVGVGPVAALDAWSNGVWVFLTFMAQFAVILMTGDAIAKSPTVTRLLERIAQWPLPTEEPSSGLGRLVPESRFHATAFVSFVAMAGALISWGLGLIVGAVMARQVGYQARKHDVKLHYPLLAAAGYTGLMIWHSGLTSSSALLMASPDSLPESFLQYTPEGLPISATLGSATNLVTVALLLVFIPPTLAVLHPEAEDVTELPDKAYRKMMPKAKGEADPTGLAEDVATDGGAAVAGERTTAADRLNNSTVLTVLIVGFPAYYFIDAWVLSGGGFASLTLNSINAFFLFWAILLWRTPSRIVAQMEDSAQNIAGIIFQFPFYAGISGLLTGTVLAEVISNFFAGFATPLTWPLIGMISAGVMNIFVPSGGGQWVAQGPILLDTTQQLGMPLHTAVLIEMMGDQLTNMIQPFWAIPLLALTDLRARDIIGYTMVAMLVGFLIMGTTMTLFLGAGLAP